MKLSRAHVNSLKRSTAIAGGRSSPRQVEEAEAAASTNLRAVAVAEAAATELNRSATAKNLREPIDRLRRNLVRLGTEPPTPGAPGQIAVRVVGTRGQKRPESLPLGGMTIEAEFASGPVETAVTDASGFALITAPASGEPQGYTVRAVASDGRVVATRRGRLTPDASPSLKLEVGFQTGLAPEFAQGQRWNTALKGASDRFDELKIGAAEEVGLQVKGLQSAARRLKDAASHVPPESGKAVPFEGVIRVSSEQRALSVDVRAD